MIQKLRTKIRLINSFNWIQSHSKILMKNTNKSRIKGFARENIDLFIQKKSLADNRLIHCKDVNKMGDLKENKTKVNKEIKETKINFNLYKLNGRRNKRSKTIQSILQRN